MASVPVYKIITVSAAAEFGISAQEINDLSEIVAVDLVTTMTMRFIDMAINSRSDFNGADADSLREWREGLYETRRNFLGIAARTSDRFDQTFALSSAQMLAPSAPSSLKCAALRRERSVPGPVGAPRPCSRFSRSGAATTSSTPSTRSPPGPDRADSSR
jgi:conjugative transfer pilus assembly protein TraH